ncbi:MAG TPA: hypothetical protein VEU75_00590 [Candidatus Acidoferrum sp.]|nr:hypothetical protein [Candidatus Acidoferrum sp.]
MMATHQHAVVWIDHKEAHVVRFGATGVDRVLLRSNSHDPHLHHKANTIGSGNAPIDVDLFERVAYALAGAQAILIAGPASAKMELKKFLDKSYLLLAKHVLGVETMDHPSEGELVAYAHNYFKAADRLQP